MEFRTNWMRGASGPGIDHIDSSFFGTPFVPVVAENPLNCGVCHLEKAAFTPSSAGSWRTPGRVGGA